MDFSHADFERCTFVGCAFRRSRFFEAKLTATDHWGSCFQEVEFSKADLGHATFHEQKSWLSPAKGNFDQVSFNRVNLSEVRMEKQVLANCQFTDCKTSALRLHGCALKALGFRGLVKNMSIGQSKRVEALDLSQAELSGFSLEKQALAGFTF
ncbi:MAG: pentapeptide repeat-containing protein, partial [Bacteroidota bacterium]